MSLPPASGKGLDDSQAYVDTAMPTQNVTEIDSEMEGIHPNTGSPSELQTRRKRRLS